VIDARDGVHDHSIQCGSAAKRASAGGAGSAGDAGGRALTDAFDPRPSLCAITKHGTPVPGLNG
jgi:hypothetical protein